MSSESWYRGGWDELFATGAGLVLGTVVVIAGGLWMGEELSGRLSLGHWPRISPVEMAWALPQLPSHLGDPSSAFPADLRSEIAPAWLFWPGLTLTLMIAILAGLVAWRILRSNGTQRGARLRRPGELRGPLWPLWARQKAPGRGLRPAPTIFLGWWGWPMLAWAVRTNAGEHAGAIGQPGCGKSGGQQMGAVVAFDGAVVSVTTKDDVLRETVEIRKRVATAHGGDVYLLDLSGKNSHRGLREAHPDALAGCADPMIAEQRANGLIPSSDSREQGGSTSEFFAASARQILRALLHAAAIEHLGIRTVIEWANTQNGQPAIDILSKGNARGMTWASFLEGLKSGALVTVAGQWATVQTALSAIQQPEVLRVLESADFDVDRFLTTKSTLYVIDAKGEGELSPTAYLIASYVEWITERAYQLAAGRDHVRRHPLLLLALDELANVCPMGSLPGILSQGPGRGVIVSWALQAFGQLMGRYGSAGARSIISSTHFLLIFGGLIGDVDFLEDLSRSLGEKEDVQLNGDGTTRSDRQRLLSVADLIDQPVGHAYVVRAGKAVRVQAPWLPSLGAFKRLPRQALEISAMGSTSPGGEDVAA